MTLPGWARQTAGALLVDVRVTPKANRDALTGIHRSADGTERLAVKVRAAPDKGAANAAVLKTLAKAAGVPKSAASLASGATSRLKTIAIAAEPAAALEALTAIVSREGA